jgi:hypothetical protein
MEGARRLARGTLVMVYVRGVSVHVRSRWRSICLYAHTGASLIGSFPASKAAVNFQAVGIKCVHKFLKPEVACLIAFRLISIPPILVLE